MRILSTARNAVCRECTERYVGCHAECVPYKQEQAVNAERKALYKESKNPLKYETDASMKRFGYRKKKSDE